jgi:hypothetical protein
MDFTPLVNEIMKAGPWALVLLLVIYLIWHATSVVVAWGKPVVGNVVDAHLTYLRNVSESQGQIHQALNNQTQALHQNNEILDRLDTKLQQHQEEKLKILSNHTDMLKKIHDNQNHKP